VRITVAITNERDNATVLATVERTGHDSASFPQWEDALATPADLAFVQCASGPQLGAFLNALQAARLMVVPLPVVVLVPRGALTMGQRFRMEGAVDFLFSPVDSREVAAEIRQFNELSWPADDEENAVFDRLRVTSLIGEHSCFLRCLEELRRAARSSANVLVLGETGTGKEEFSRAIHQLSRRRANRFLAVNCAALQESLLESELFGHIRGAYTGASVDREGRFAAVGAGTLLLDEIGDMPMPLQMKLLRVIEHRKFERLGENDSIPFHGRLVCATSRDLDAEVEAGRFRRDLLGRINQIRIELPALRARRSDIPILARLFLDRHRGARMVEISSTAMDVLEQFDFSMNVRQLENAVIHALAQSDPGDLIVPLHWPRELSAHPREASTAPSVPTYDKALSYLDAREIVTRAFDREYLARLVREFGGNQSAAARAAGIDRKTLAERLRDGDSNERTAES
jgi:DNA-binding NtrC family response regulator